MKGGEGGNSCLRQPEWQRFVLELQGSNAEAGRVWFRYHFHIGERRFHCIEATSNFACFACSQTCKGLVVSPHAEPPLTPLLPPLHCGFVICCKRWCLGEGFGGLWESGARQLQQSTSPLKLHNVFVQ